MIQKISPPWRQVIHIGILLMAIIVAYSAIWQNSLVWDDHDLIEQWKDIQSWNNIPLAFTHATNPKYPDTYRPVRFLVGIVLYSLFSTHPMGYHAITLGIHCGISILLYLFLKKIIGKSSSIPFVSALLFGIHPIHVEAIVWISSGIDMMGFFWMMLALTITVYSTQTKHRLLALFFAALSYFSLEITVILPLLLGLSIVTQPSLRKLSLRIVLPHLLLAAVMLYIRWRVVGITEVFGYIDNSFPTTMLLMSRVVLLYLGLLIFPVGLTINHIVAPGVPSFMVELGSAFPTVITAIRAVPTISIQTGLMFILIVGSIIGFFKTRITHPLIAWAIGWFWITLLPVLNIIPGHTLMAERYLYMPSVAWSVLVAFLTTTLLPKKFAFIVIFSISIWYSAVTLSYTRTWKDDTTLWKHATKHNPISYISFASLGKLSVANHDIDAAINAYSHILTLYPEQKRTVGYLTELYITNKRFSEAIKLIQSVLLLRASDADAWAKLGDIYEQMNDRSSAIKAYQKALSINPNQQFARERLIQNRAL